MSTYGPEILSVKRSAGVAGQYQLTAMVQYPGEAPEATRFVGSVYGGPIVMVMPSGAQVFVSDRVTDRIGTELTEAWVRSFFAPVSS
jgi:hypothetical protein